MRKYYAIIRKLHLYFGLFISPFVLIFGLSVLIFNHPGLIDRINPVKALPEIKAQLQGVSYDGPNLETAKAVMAELNIKGEINFISRNGNSIAFPVNKPGLSTFIKVNTNNDSVFISRTYEGPLRSMSFLHAMPGPHNVTVRGNSGFIKTWRVVADVVVYLLLFLTFSGVLLWYFIKAERVVGIYALGLGLLFFSGILFLIFLS
jgi:hypothetical protein